MVSGDLMHHIIASAQDYIVSTQDAIWAKQTLSQIRFNIDFPDESQAVQVSGLVIRMPVIPDSRRLYGKIAPSRILDFTPAPNTPVNSDQ